jgi:CubicO group peptidase (beta-lactamase class C family)
MPFVTVSPSASVLRRARQAVALPDRAVALRGRGTTAAFLVNPGRNLGRFLDVTRLARNGDDVDLIGKPFGAKAERVISTGSIDVPDQRLRTFMAWHGDYYDLTRADKVATTGFYPRGNPPAKYRYTPPPALDDGWPVASLAEVGMSQPEIEAFVQWLVDMPIESVHSSQVHAVLIARHGKLVLEEYFHGFHRDLPHDTRSAAKSLTSMLVGAAIESGAKLSLDTPVYSAMNGGEFPAGLDAGRRAITVEHLLTMSAGLDCDDADDQSRGNEDTMQQQPEQPDWYRYTLDLAVEAKPDAKSVYCSAYPNLLGGVLQRTTGERLPEMVDRLIARPLGITRYHMNLAPTGDAYMGGGNHFLPRDFMKLGQVMLNGGTWGGRRLLSTEFAKRSARDWYESRGIRYGYLWWVMDYRYRDRTVRAFFAGGNGGQTVICIPELDLLVAFYGGNYSDAATLKPQREFVPQHILPAVLEPDGSPTAR